MFTHSPRSVPSKGLSGWCHLCQLETVFGSEAKGMLYSLIKEWRFARLHSRVHVLPKRRWPAGLLCLVFVRRERVRFSWVVHRCSLLVASDASAQHSDSASILN